MIILDRVHFFIIYRIIQKKTKYVDVYIIIERNNIISWTKWNVSHYTRSIRNRSHRRSGRITYYNLKYDVKVWITGGVCVVEHMSLMPCLKMKNGKIMTQARKT